MQIVSWVKSEANTWLPLMTMNLDGIRAGAAGCYLIWHDGSPGRVVRVGQGDIRDRLSCHRLEPEITAYQTYGTLRVTWAELLAYQLDGVERYLADQWKPLVGDRFPMAAPIAVNSPFAA